MKPRDIASRSRELQDLRKLDPDGFMRKTFTLPVDDARAKAREFINAFPAAGYMTIVEQWDSCPTVKFSSRCDGCRRRTRC